MIRIKLLGGARKALGKQEVLYEANEATVIDLLSFLKNIALDSRILDQRNLIIAINGIDSSALGENPVAKNGDVVTVVTVVHGGAAGMHKIHPRRSTLKRQNSGYAREPEDDKKQWFKVDEFFAVFFGVRDLDKVNEPKALLEKIRSLAKEGQIVQGVNADRIFGTGHLAQVVSIVIEAKKRGIMIAKKIEVELLLRFAITSQISEAITIAGIQQGHPACFILISKNLSSLIDFESLILQKFNLSVDNSVLRPTVGKMRQITRANSWRSQILSCRNFAGFLTERAAIMQE